jgi:hypothetical protein
MISPRGDDPEVRQLIQQRGNSIPHQPIVFDECYGYHA